MTPDELLVQLKEAKEHFKEQVSDIKSNALSEITALRARLDAREASKELDDAEKHRIDMYMRTRIVGFCSITGLLSVIIGLVFGQAQSTNATKAYHDAYVKASELSAKQVTDSVKATAQAEFSQKAADAAAISAGNASNAAAKAGAQLEKLVEAYRAKVDADAQAIAATMMKDPAFLDSLKSQISESLDTQKRLAKLETAISVNDQGAIVIKGKAGETLMSLDAIKGIAISGDLNIGGQVSALRSQFSDCTVSETLKFGGGGSGAVFLREPKTNNFVFSAGYGGYMPNVNGYRKPYARSTEILYFDGSTLTK